MDRVKTSSKVLPIDTPALPASKSPLKLIFSPFVQTNPIKQRVDSNDIIYLYFHEYL